MLRRDGLLRHLSLHICRHTVDTVEIDRDPFSSNILYRCYFPKLLPRNERPANTMCLVGDLTAGIGTI